MSNKNWLSIMLLLLATNLGLIGVAYLQVLTRSNGSLISIMPNSERFALYALERPNVSTRALLSWATLAATATFTFDFVNYKDQIEALHDYFTTDGYDNFMTSIQNAETLSTIEEKKLILSAVAIGPAIVLTEENNGDKRNWRIQVPLLVRYQSANVDETRQQVVDLLVTQVSTQDAPKGIGIAQYVAREAGSELTS